jgi:phosphatidylglycerol:prolipoprotein diacylglycerol transferase
MNPRLLHLFGPLWINSYGLMIALGLLLTLFISYNSSLRKKISSGDFFLNTVFMSTITGFIGGRLLFVILDWQAFSAHPIEILYPWEGGYSLLGAFLVVPVFLLWHLNRSNIPVLSFFDLLSLYVPLLQAISRLGCFFAGCCYGIQLTSKTWYSIMYTNPDSLAPLYVFLHPTQLYSSLASLAIFCILRVLSIVFLETPGRITSLFFILEGAARFIVDFWRGDRDGCVSIGGSQSTCSVFIAISAYQLLALGFCILGIIGLFVFNKSQSTPQQGKTT